MLVRKLSLAGELMIAYEGIIAEYTPLMVRLLARWDWEDRDLGYTIFETGDTFTEYFYADRWFNIMRIDHHQTGNCKGWYCNISFPAQIDREAVEYIDLYLDLWVNADGTYLILDEDEFAGALLDEVTRKQARAGLDELLIWVRDGSGPFAALRSD
jgi:uncharacterized protein